MKSAQYDGPVGEPLLDLLDELNKYNGLLTAMWTLGLAVITFMYLRETRLQRIATETVLKLENARLRVGVQLIQHDSQKPTVSLELETQNVGTRPTRRSEFKLLTKRSPRESIENVAFPGTRSQYMDAVTHGHIVFEKATVYLGPGERTRHYVEVPTALLDYDWSFYLWVKYWDFYDKSMDEIRLVSLARANSVSITDVNATRDQVNHRLKIPVTYW